MKKAVEKIFKKHFKETPLSILPLKGREGSNVFSVRLKDNRYCIKFDSIYSDRSIMRMEKKVMEALKNAGVYCPRPIQYGQEGLVKKKRAEYLIMSFVEGNLLSSEWRKLAEKEKRVTSIKLLEILNKIKKIPVSGFGPLNENLNGLMNSFTEYMNLEITKFEQSNVVALIDKDLWDKAKRSLRNYAKAGTHNPCFVHADFRLRNFIYKNGQLALFDFANAMSMDPVFDFIRFLKVNTSEKQLNDKHAKFLKALYIKKYYDGNNYEEDEIIYKLLLTIRFSPWYYSTGRTERLKLSFLEMKSLVNNISGNI